MMRFPVFGVVVSLALLAPNVSRADSIIEPGGTIADAGLAASNPDEFAWQLFFYLNHQAKSGIPGVADETKKFGQLDPDASVVWETWSLASPPPTLTNGDCNEVYKKDGSKPVDWAKLDRTKRALCLSPNLEREMALGGGQGTPANGFFAPAADSQEVRMNRAAYEFIARDDIQLYNLDGQQALLVNARKTFNRQLIVFPPAAKEVKAVWQIIDDTEQSRKRYLWREGVWSLDGGGDGQKHVFGLVALHILTKDLSNWFWADFSHVDCESKPPVNACDISAGGLKVGHGNEEARTDPVDKTTRGLNGKGSGAGPSGTNGVRNETVGTVWSNYILRGSQTEFTRPDGEPTILSNPVIEAGFQRSSCISCHALATIGLRSRDINGDVAKNGPVDRLNGSGQNNSAPLGAPNSTLFGADVDLRFTQAGQEVLFLQTDFLWSPFLARYKKQ
jgi:hypothetical protein